MLEPYLRRLETGIVQECRATCRELWRAVDPQALCVPPAAVRPHPSRGLALALSGLGGLAWGGVVRRLG